MLKTIKKWLILFYKKTLSLLKSTFLNESFLIVSLIIILIGTLSTNIIKYRKFKHETEVYKEKIETLADTVLISDYCLNRLIEYRAPNPYVALAQFKIESGHFTSKLFKENNNPMGMKYPTRRPTTAKKAKNGYAYYESLDDAILDYIFYSLYQTKGSVSDAEYIDKVLNSYAEDDSYKKKVTNLTNKLKTHGKK